VGLPSRGVGGTTFFRGGECAGVAPASRRGGAGTRGGAVTLRCCGAAPMAGPREVVGLGVTGVAVSCADGRTSPGGVVLAVCTRPCQTLLGIDMNSTHNSQESHMNWGN
jgi:hypothetical protein